MILLGLVFAQMSRAEAHLGVSPGAPSQDEPTLTLEQVRAEVGSYERKICLHKKTLLWKKIIASNAQLILNYGLKQMTTKYLFIS